MAPQLTSDAAAAIHFALLDEPQQPWEGQENLRRQEEILRRTGDGFTVTSTAADADTIVFLESNNMKTKVFIPRLLRDDRVNRYPEKCFTLNYRDDPTTFFPGMYYSLPASRHEENWSRPGACYLGDPNPHAGEYEHRPRNPRQLFCFRGSLSHSVRGRLARLAEGWGSRNPVTLVDRWFNHSEREQRDYLQEIVDSEFGLCPRGLAPNSHRMYEVMRLGRVPVVIADDWLAPRGPDWETCSIRVAEDALETLPAVLQAASPLAAAMGQRARIEWERWFAPDIVLREQIAEIVELARCRRALPPPDFAKRWRSRTFYRAHGWSLDQRIRRRLARVR